MQRKQRALRFLSFTFILFYRSLSNALDKLAQRRLLHRLPQTESLSIPCLQLIVFQQLFCTATGRLAMCVSKEKKHDI